jgi:NAD-dependent dihydropyrimidine dehydrogenase PreA subunit
MKLKRIPIDLDKHQIPGGTPIIDKELCKGCTFCVKYCPKEVLEMSREFNPKGYHFPQVVKGKENECVACRFCEFICPEFAIFIKEEKRNVTIDDILKGTSK